MDDHDRRTQARSYLAALLPRVMADGRLDEAERGEMLRFFRGGFLGRDDVRDVFRSYLVALGRDILADGVVTEEERARCRAAVRELRIPATFVPPELGAIVKGEG